MFSEKQGNVWNASKNQQNLVPGVGECIEKCRLPDWTDVPSWMNWEDPPTTWLFKTPFVLVAVDNSRQGLWSHCCCCILCSVFFCGNSQVPIPYSVFCVLAVLSLCSTNFLHWCWQMHDTVFLYSLTLAVCVTLLYIQSVSIHGLCLYIQEKYICRSPLHEVRNQVVQLFQNFSAKKFAKRGSAPDTKIYYKFPLIFYVFCSLELFGTTFALFVCFLHLFVCWVSCIRCMSCINDVEANFCDTAVHCGLPATLPIIAHGNFKSSWLNKQVLCSLLPYSKQRSLARK